jgi:ABC-2 type transport system ATP-binding protein
MLAIETFALQKTYSVGFWRKKPAVALRPLTLSVEEGEVFGYLGPNGAGKTTTLKLLMGLIFPTAGSAKILGMDIGDRHVKSQIGYQHEQPYFYDYLTAHELLNYYAQLSGIPAGDRVPKVRAVLQRVGLGDLSPKLQLRKLSKGMLQRVGIAQAILHNPRLVFLDEPMSGLDPIGRREIRDLIQSLKDEAKTVFFSTHILSDAEALCDRVAVIDKGELRGVGVMADLTSRVHGNFEVIWRRGTALRALADLGCQCSMTGEIGSAVVPDSLLDAALEELRRTGAELVSVNPIRATLEDYFVEKLSAKAAGGTL